MTIDPGVEERLYHDMSKFIGFMARRYALPDHWLLSEDDLTGECYLALVRVVQKYGDKPMDELKTISKASIRNAIKTLQAKVFGTGRVVELDALSIDEPTGNDSEGEVLESCVAGNSIDPAVWAESSEWIAELLPRLDDLERRIIDALLGGSDRVRMYLKLHADRRSWLYNDPTIIITPLVVARALCEDVEVVEQAYIIIKTKIAEVL